MNTFGAPPKKKSKLPVIAAVALAAVILVGAGIFTASKLIDNNGDGGNISEASGNPTADTAEYSKTDEKRIASIISEAEALADLPNDAALLEKSGSGTPEEGGGINAGRRE